MQIGSYYSNFKNLGIQKQNKHENTAGTSFQGLHGVRIADENYSSLKTLIKDFKGAIQGKFKETTLYLCSVSDEADIHFAEAVKMLGGVSQLLQKMPALSVVTENHNDKSNLLQFIAVKLSSNAKLNTLRRVASDYGAVIQGKFQDTTLYLYSVSQEAMDHFSTVVRYIPGVPRPLEDVPRLCLPAPEYMAKKEVRTIGNTQVVAILDKAPKSLVNPFESHTVESAEPSRVVSLDAFRQRLKLSRE